MKKIIALTIVVLACIGLQAQTRVEEKQKTIVNEMIQRRLPRIESEIVVAKAVIDSTFLRVVDNKIYRGKSLEFDLIPSSDLALVNAITDLTSETGIRYIFIYKRKK